MSLCMSTLLLFLMFLLLLASSSMADDVGDDTPPGSLVQKEENITMLISHLPPHRHYNDIDDDNRTVILVGLMWPRSGQLSLVWDDWHTAVGLALERVNNESMIGHGFIMQHLSVIDTGSDRAIGNEAAIQLKNLNASVVIGAASSAVSSIAHLTFKRYGIPQCSPSSTSTVLSSRAEFPYFMRTVSSDSAQGRVLVQIAEYLGATKIAIIGTNNDYGHGGMSVVQSGAARLNIKVTVSWVLNGASAEATAKQQTNDYDGFFDRICRTNTQVIVLFMHGGDAKQLLISAAAAGMTDNKYVWLGPDGLNTLEPSPLSQGLIISKPNEMHHYRFLTEFRERTGKPLANPAPFSANAYDCVILLAKLLNVIHRNGQLGDLKRLGDRMPTNITEFYGASGHVVVENGDRYGSSYVILNYHMSKSNHVGSWNPIAGLNISKSIYFRSMTRSNPLPPVITNEILDSYHERVTNQKSVTAVLSTVMVVLVAFTVSVAMFVIRRRRQRNHDKLDPYRLSLSDVQITGKSVFGTVLGKYREMSVALKRFSPSAASPQPATLLLSTGRVGGRDEAANRALNGIVNTMMGLDGTMSEQELKMVWRSYNPLYSSRLTMINDLNAEKDRDSDDGLGAESQSWRLTTRTETTHKLLESIHQLSNLRHANIVPVIGVCFVGSLPLFSMCEHMTKGPLRNLLRNEELELDWPFVCAISREVIAGLIYLHGRGLLHGRLSSNSIMVDHTWTARLTDFEVTTLRSQGFVMDTERGVVVSHSSKSSTFQPANNNCGLFPTMQDPFVTECLARREPETLFWTAPEVLRGEACASASTDIYSLGVVLLEMICRRDPLEHISSTVSPASRLQIIQDLAPSSQPLLLLPANVESEFPADFVDLARRCSMVDPTKRPRSAVAIAASAELIDSPEFGHGVVDVMSFKLAHYSANLESIVDQRTMMLRVERENLRREKEVTERLLANVLPPKVIKLLKEGASNDALLQRVESASVAFFDICSFTQMCTRSTPNDIVGLLNTVFMLMERLTDEARLTKVKTIGDAYMVVAGAPEPDPDHSVKVGMFCLTVLKEVSKNRLTDLNGNPLLLRGGISTGELVAGIIGRRSFAYDLWGATVNMASRMESSSEPNRIACTSAFYKATNNSFLFQERPAMHVKGCGTIVTYFLVSVRKRKVTDPTCDSREANSNRILTTVRRNTFTVKLENGGYDYSVPLQLANCDQPTIATRDSSDSSILCAINSNNDNRKTLRSEAGVCIRRCRSMTTSLLQTPALPDALEEIFRTSSIKPLSPSSLDHLDPLIHHV